MDDSTPRKDHYGTLRRWSTARGKSVSCGYDELLLERGYTGHEHLPQFGLINMNVIITNGGYGIT